MYLQHFGFTRFPFSITAHSHELFLSQQYREAMAHMHYSLQHPGGVIVLTGEVGTGKTTLARNFLQQQDNCTETAFILNPLVPAPELIASICQELGIKPHRSGGIKPNLDKLHQFLLAAYQQNRRVLILIDEAQHLCFDALEQLRLLTNLESSSGKLVQIVMVGQEELRSLLAQPELRQFRQRVIGHFHLQRLTRQQTGAYIRHRLEQANGSPALIPPALYRLIYNNTSGVPRLINLLCDRALMGAYALGHRQVDRALVKRAIAEMLVQPGKENVKTRQQRIPGARLKLNLQDKLTAPPDAAVADISQEQPFTPPPLHVLRARGTVPRTKSGITLLRFSFARPLMRALAKARIQIAQLHLPKLGLRDKLIALPGLALYARARQKQPYRPSPASVAQAENAVPGPGLLRFLLAPPLTRALLIAAVVIPGGWLTSNAPFITAASPTADRLVSVPDGTASLLPSAVLNQHTPKNSELEALLPIEPAPSTPAKIAAVPEPAQAAITAPSDPMQQLTVTAVPKAPAASNNEDSAMPFIEEILPRPQTVSESELPTQKLGTQPEPLKPWQETPTPTATALSPTPAKSSFDSPPSRLVLPAASQTIKIDSLAELPPGKLDYAEYSQLLKLWNIDAPPFDSRSAPCLVVADYQLTCAHITADLDLVRTIGLPAVLQSSANAQRANRAAAKFLLAGANDEYALLWRANNYYRIATSTLASEWRGTGHYFVQAPQDFRTAFRPDSTSDSIVWLINALSKVDGKYALDAPIASYNEALVDSVKTFQQQLGLVPDGIAGLRTVALLNRMLFGPPTLTTTFD